MKKKVLLINGSPHVQGNTARALEEVASAIRADGLETEIFHVGMKPVRGCVACGACRERGRCAFDDDVANEILGKLLTADAIVNAANETVRKRRDYEKSVRDFADG